MDMTVERDLIPFFRHFKQVVFTQQLTDDAGLSRHRGEEIVGKFQLPEAIITGSHQFLHDLQKYSCRVPAHMAVGTVQHLVHERAQRIQALVALCALQRSQQVNDGIGNPQPARFRQLFYAVGVEVGIKEVIQMAE